MTAAAATYSRTKTFGGGTSRGSSRKLSSSKSSSRTATSTTSERPRRTSSFDRFATPTPDYWTGSTAPDFDYWDELSASDFDNYAAVFPEDVQSSVAPAPLPEEVELPRRRRASAPASAPEKAPADLRFYGICAALIIVAIALIGFVYVSLYAETVEVEVVNQEYTDAISTASDTSKILEVQQTVYSKASYIRSSAVVLGMLDPESTEALVLDPDTVATDDDGNLSLSLSVERVTQAD